MFSLFYGRRASGLRQRRDCESVAMSWHALRMYARKGRKHDGMFKGPWVTLRRPYRLMASWMGLRGAGSKGVSLKRKRPCGFGHTQGRFENLGTEGFEGSRSFTDTKDQVPLLSELWGHARGMTEVSQP